MRRFVIELILTIGVTLGMATHAAKAQPWDVYPDPLSSEVCDLVNAQNAVLVVFSDTGELVIVSDDVSDVDLFLGESFVDLDGNVFFGGFPFGVIAFATDGDGFRSLWWLTDAGTVFAIDPFAFFPFDSGAFPEEFFGVPCDACPFWDHPEDCAIIILDSDDDGVPDEDDSCPDTFPGEVVDLNGCSCEDLGDCDCFFDIDQDGIADCDDFCNDTPFGANVNFDGCACFEIDEDRDGVDNCDDLCPNSPGNAAVDIDGCPIVVVTPPPVNIVCGNVSALMLGLMVTGLFVMRLTGRRDW